MRRLEPSTQCERCIHGRQNRGLVIAIEKVDFFCSRTARIVDEEVAAILEPLLKRLARNKECPHFDDGAELPDSYRASDLEAWLSDEDSSLCWTD